MSSVGDPTTTVVSLALQAVVYVGAGGQQPLTASAPQPGGQLLEVRVRSGDPAPTGRSTVSRARWAISASASAVRLPAVRPSSGPALSAYVQAAARAGAGGRVEEPGEVPPAVQAGWRAAAGAGGLGVVVVASPGSSGSARRWNPRGLWHCDPARRPPRCLRRWSAHHRWCGSAPRIARTCSRVIAPSANAAAVSGSTSRSARAVWTHQPACPAGCVDFASQSPSCDARPTGAPPRAIKAEARVLA